MSIMRINEFRARDGGGDALRDRLKAILPLIEASSGCQSCHLMQSHKNAAHILLLEVWDSVESHQASLQNLSPEVFKEAKKLLAAPPTGEYYSYC